MHYKKKKKKKAILVFFPAILLEVSKEQWVSPALNYEQQTNFAKEDAHTAGCCIGSPGMSTELATAFITEFGDNPVERSLQ